MMTAVRQVAIGAVMLCALCLIAGRPQVFSDTKAYYSLGQEIALALTPGHQAASDTALRGHPLPPAQSATATKLAYTVAASRSPYWSVLLYALSAIGSAWLFVAAQALVAAITIWVAAGAWDMRRAFLPATALLATASSLPVFVLFLMPDLFTGLMILAAAAVLFGEARLTAREQAWLWLVIAGGAAFHTSNVLLLSALSGAVVLCACLIRAARPVLRRTLLLLSAAAAAVVLAFAYPAGVLAIRHQPIYAPPFVAARLIADGPGRQLLRDTCRADRPWEWCRFASRPLNDVNQILWDTAPATATFQAANYAQRVRIIKEQPRFVAAVVRHAPLAVLDSVVANVTHLFFRFGTLEVLEDPTPRYRDPDFAIFTRIVPGTEPCREGRMSCAPRISAQVMDVVIGAVLIASIGAIAYTLGTRTTVARRWSPTLLFVLTAMVGNAMICGMLSGNAERYQSRITWLVPLFAMFVLSGRRDDAIVGALRGRPNELDVGVSR